MVVMKFNERGNIIKLKDTTYIYEFVQGICGARMIDLADITHNDVWIQHVSPHEYLKYTNQVVRIWRLITSGHGDDRKLISLERVSVVDGKISNDLGDESLYMSDLLHMIPKEEREAMLMSATALSRDYLNKKLTNIISGPFKEIMAPGINDVSEDIINLFRMKRSRVFSDPDCTAAEVLDIISSYKLTNHVVLHNNRHSDTPSIIWENITNIRHSAESLPLDIISIMEYYFSEKIKENAKAFNIITEDNKLKDNMTSLHIENLSNQIAENVAMYKDIVAKNNELSNKLRVSEHARLAAESKLEEIGLDSGSVNYSN